MVEDFDRSNIKVTAATQKNVPQYLPPENNLKTGLIPFVCVSIWRDGERFFNLIAVYEYGNLPV